MITITNTGAKAVTLTNGLAKQALFSDYKHRKWYGNRNANKIPHECFCGQRFPTVQARDRHMRNCHDDGDAA
jgi:hypothetical protein